MLTEIGNQGKERVWGEDGEGTAERPCASTWRGHPPEPGSEEQSQGWRYRLDYHR